MQKGNVTVDRALSWRTMHDHQWLDEGAARGIITAEQRDALLALARSTSAPIAPERREEPGLSGANIAYGVGALLALFAMGWFVIDRWKALGPTGVMLVAAGYGALFLFAAHVLEREGFPTARGVAVLLAVAITPLAAWGAGATVGLWSEESLKVCATILPPVFPCDSTPVALELTTVLAALIAVRRVRFGPLAIPFALTAFVLPVHWLHLLRDHPSTRTGDAWGWMFAASVALVAAYAVERHTAHGEMDPDYGRWMQVVAAFTMVVGLAQVVSVHHMLRHLGPVFALAALTVSVYLRRTAWTIAGAVILFAYLIWLATDVFKLGLAFPLLLVVSGLVIIIGTVWVQRRLPTLFSRDLRDPSGRPRLPTGWGVTVLPLLVSTGMLLMVVPGRQRAEDRASRLRLREDRRLMREWRAKQAQQRNFDSAARVSSGAPKPPDAPR
jgi:hypothetical protein